MKRMKLRPLPTPKYPVPVPKPLDDESLPDEIKEIVREVKVESIVYHGCDYEFQKSYKLTYKKENKNSEFLT